MKSKYKELERSIQRTTLWTGIILLAVFILIRILFNPFSDGVITNSVVNVLTKVFFLDIDVAEQVYRRFARGFRTEFILIAFFLVLLFVFQRSTKKAVGYIQSIDNALETMTTKSEDSISLPSELEFIEQKLLYLQKDMESQIHQIQLADKNKNDLLVYLAHDIRTPLTSIIGYLNLLQEMPQPSNEQLAASLSVIQKNANRLESLVDDFFEIARYSTGSIKLKKESLNLSLLLHQITEELYPLLEEQDKQYTLDFEASVLYHGDGNQLARVFSNLLKNAVNYSKDHSTIGVSLKKLSDSIQISITSQGDTLTSEELSQLFEHHVRLDYSRSSKQGGAGLGLPIAKEITELHGGVLTASSNHGETTFLVTLPQDNFMIS